MSRATLYLLFLLAAVAPTHAQKFTNNADLKDRVADFFQAVDSGRFDRVLEMASPKVRDSVGEDSSGLEEALRRIDPEGGRTKIESARAYKDYGVARVTVSAPTGEDGTWTSVTYESTWTLADGVWLYDGFDSTPLASKAVRAS